MEIYKQCGIYIIIVWSYATCMYVSSRMHDWGIALWYDIENLCKTKESERKGVIQVKKSGI